MRLFLAFWFLALLFDGCGGEQRGLLDGTWDVTASSVGGIWILELNDNNGKVSGTWNFTAGEPLAVTGVVQQSGDFAISARFQNDPDRQEFRLKNGKVVGDSFDALGSVLLRDGTEVDGGSVHGQRR